MASVLTSAIEKAAEKQSGKPAFSLTDVSGSLAKQQAFKAGQYQPGVGYISGASASYGGSPVRGSSGALVSPIERQRQVEMQERTAAAKKVDELATQAEDAFKARDDALTNVEFQTKIFEEKISKEYGIRDVDDFQRKIQANKFISPIAYNRMVNEWNDYQSIINPYIVQAQELQQKASSLGSQASSLSQQYFGPITSLPKEVIIPKQVQGLEEKRVFGPEALQFQSTIGKIMQPPVGLGKARKRLYQLRQQAAGLPSEFSRLETEGVRLTVQAKASPYMSASERKKFDERVQKYVTSVEAVQSKAAMAESGLSQYEPYSMAPARKQFILETAPWQVIPESYGYIGGPVGQTIAKVLGLPEKEDVYTDIPFLSRMLPTSSKVKQAFEKGLTKTELGTRGEFVLSQQRLKGLGQYYGQMGGEIVELSALGLIASKILPKPTVVSKTYGMETPQGTKLVSVGEQRGVFGNTPFVERTIATKAIGTSDDLAKTLGQKISPETAKSIKLYKTGLKAEELRKNISNVPSGIADFFDYRAKGFYTETPSSITRFLETQAKGKYIGDTLLPAKSYLTGFEGMQEAIQGLKYRTSGIAKGIKEAGTSLGKTLGIPKLKATTSDVTLITGKGTLGKKTKLSVYEDLKTFSNVWKGTGKTYNISDLIEVKKIGEISTKLPSTKLKSFPTEEFFAKSITVTGKNVPVAYLETAKLGETYYTAGGVIAGAGKGTKLFNIYTGVNLSQTGKRLLLGEESVKLLSATKTLEPSRLLGMPAYSIFKAPAIPPTLSTIIEPTYFKAGNIITPSLAPKQPSIPSSIKQFYKGPLYKTGLEWIKEEKEIAKVVKFAEEQKRLSSAVQVPGSYGSVSLQLPRVAQTPTEKLFESEMRQIMGGKATGGIPQIKTGIPEIDAMVSKYGISNLAKKSPLGGFSQAPRFDYTGQAKFDAYVKELREGTIKTPFGEQAGRTPLEKEIAKSVAGGPTLGYFLGTTITPSLKFIMKGATKTFIEQQLKYSIIPTIKIGTGIRTKIGVGQATGQASGVTQKIAESARESARQAMLSMQKMAQSQRTQTASMTKALTKTQTGTISKMQPLPKIPYFPFTFPSLRKPKTTQAFFGFKVLVRGKGTKAGGKWKPGKLEAISQFVLPKEQALALGQSKVISAAKRTFKLVPAIGTLGEYKGQQFKPEMFYRRGRKYTERTKYAIDTPGELLEITYKGISKKKSLSRLLGTKPVKKKTKKTKRR